LATTQEFITLGVEQPGPQKALLEEVAVVGLVLDGGLLPSCMG